MKYASFVTPRGVESWGVGVDDDVVADLGPGGAGLAPTLKQAIAGGVFGSVHDLDGVPRYDVGEISFLPVIPDPGKIVCIGVNYRSHQDETGKPPPVAPTVFTRFADSQMGHLQPAVNPPTTTQFDYEGEMAVVIGRRAHLVAEDDAWDVVAGYAPYNDFSVRDWQRATSQWTPGKNFPATGAFGPFLVPAVEVGAVDALKLTTRVNGDLRQSASVADLVFDIPRLIAHVTGFTPLSPGDVIVTGTPGGVGLFMEPQGLLEVGDVVEVEITGLGLLRNTVTAG
ncbi:MAG: fumarylacetoacetate hydrolase family protein [Janthinobacterium lividum]